MTAPGATGQFTISVIPPGPRRGVVEHWAYDTHIEMLADLGTVAERAKPGSELVLRDPEGTDLMRLTRNS